MVCQILFIFSKNQLLVLLIFGCCLLHFFFIYFCSNLYDFFPSTNFWDFFVLISDPGCADTGGNPKAEHHMGVWEISAITKEKTATRSAAGGGGRCSSGQPGAGGRGDHAETGVESWGTHSAEPGPMEDDCRAGREVSEACPLDAAGEEQVFLGCLSQTWR